MARALVDATLIDPDRNTRDQNHAEANAIMDTVDVEAAGYAGWESVWANILKGRDTLRALLGMAMDGDASVSTGDADE